MKPFTSFRAALSSQSVKLSLIFSLAGIPMFGPAMTTEGLNRQPVTSSNTSTLTANGKISQIKIASPPRPSEMI